MTCQRVHAKAYQKKSIPEWNSSVAKCAMCHCAKTRASEPTTQAPTTTRSTRDPVAVGSRSALESHGKTR